MKRCHAFLSLTISWLLWVAVLNILAATHIIWTNRDYLWGDHGNLHFIVKSWRDVFFKQFINNPKFGTVLLATQSDNKVFGFAILCIQCSTLVPTFSCVLTDLYVAPEARRHGWAQQLLTQSRAWAKKNHYKSLKWTTATDNQVARNLYDKIGTFQEFQVFYKWSVWC